MFENVGGGEILLILLVILIFFGPKKIPELAQSLGKGLRKFNDAKAGIESQVKEAIKEPLEAITGAKEGFESSLRAAAAPLHAELKLPQNLTPTPAPPAHPELPIAPETQAREAQASETQVSQPQASAQTSETQASETSKIPSHEA